MSAPNDIVREFLVESYENLDRLDRDLVVLEQKPDDAARLGSIFRTIHTIKGTCGFFAFAKLEAVSHAGENLLSRLREGQLHLNAEITSALLGLVDAVRLILGNIEQTGLEGDGDYSALIAVLTRLQDESAEECATHAVAADLAPAQSAEPDAVVQDATPRSPDFDTLRVDVSLLDKLMTLVGELVLTRNQILQYTRAQKAVEFLGTTQRLNQITTELQEGVMKTRMQSIGTVWNRFPRLVRDLALACGKQVRLHMEGMETELDKTILEAIKDPLTHIVRNAIDHGVETPDVRLAAGKKAEGTVSLRAFHEEGQVIIEIADDGGGIDSRRVKESAIRRGMIDRDAAARLNDREAINLIFLPGFTTADKVTSISGRGVGMDVVKINIEKIGGTVVVQSRSGQGTTLQIKIPLTLAIIPALIVSCAGDRYAIPQVNLLELVRLEGEQAHQVIEKFHGAPVFRLRGGLLPLVYLQRELGLESGCQAGDEQQLNIAVLQADHQQFGLVVDGIYDTAEVVVKPLGKQLRSIPVYAGATIMGDGQVALILDVLGIAQRTGVVSETRDRVLADVAAATPELQEKRETFLLCGLGKDRQLAIPLSKVGRLEKIARDAVEWADRQEVVQYRGRILPLVHLSGLLGDPADDVEQELLQIVVCADEGRSVGLVVDEIHDIGDFPVDLERRPAGRLILGSAIIRKNVTDILDVPSILRSAATANIAGTSA